MLVVDRQKTPNSTQPLNLRGREEERNIETQRQRPIPSRHEGRQKNELPQREMVAVLPKTHRRQSLLRSDPCARETRVCRDTPLARRAARRRPIGRPPPSSRLALIHRTGKLETCRRQTDATKTDSITYGCWRVLVVKITALLNAVNERGGRSPTVEQGPTPRTIRFVNFETEGRNA